METLLALLSLDGTLKQCNQVKKKQMIKEIANYDILIMKDFYHLARNTGVCIELLQEFALQGIEVITMEDGSFSFQFQDAPFDKKLKICVYHSKYKEDGDRTIETQRKIFKTFVSHKTNWEIVDVFVDEANSQSDKVQTEIFKVIENKKKYDLLLIKNFNSLHWRTAKFCHRRNELGLPIYSLKEGYLPYEKRTGGDLICITRSCAEKNSLKIEVGREIQTMIAGKKMESRIMNAIPLGMIVYFRLCSPGFLDCMSRAGGRIVMTILMSIYLIAYYWSNRICDIRV